MKRILFSAAAAVTVIASQLLFAGPEPLETRDYKTAPQPVAPPPCNWTGFYIGAHGGYAWGDLTFEELGESSDPAYKFDQTGFFGGGQIGYNLQLGSFFVFGIEGSFAGSNIDDDAFIGDSSDRKRAHVGTDWIATAAGRVGFSFWRNRILAYAKGGAAFTNFNYLTREIGDNGKFEADEDRTVPLLGFGLEYALTCHWSVKLEYNHLFFDTENVTGTEHDGDVRESRTFSSDPTQDSVQAGVNFRF
jgi:outer membrane immunogenic protein